MNMNSLDSTIPLLYLKVDMVVIEKPGWNGRDGALQGLHHCMQMRLLRKCLTENLIWFKIKSSFKLASKYSIKCRILSSGV